MSKNRKVIISCAVTGSIHTPSMSPYLPITPEEIVRESVAAAEAGASIIHLHARNPEDGRPSPSPDVFMDFLPRIRQQTDAVLNISTGGSPAMTFEDRIAAAKRASPEVASLNMGSMNFAIFPLAERYSTWKYDWEKPYLEASRGGLFKNTFADIEAILSTLGTECGTRFEFECYDVGHLYTLRHFVDKGLAKPPLFIQFVIGILGGIGPAPEHLLHLRDTATKLFGDDYQWSALAAGRHQMPFATMAAVLGGNVRVGLEDSLGIGPGKLATSSAEQVAKIRAILTELSLDIATPDEVREMLALKGADKTAI
jgi:uncharacterized protein (DUF849 family)